MRMLKKNKQRMFYSLYSSDVPVYETDKDGNIVYIEVDGVQVPKPTLTKKAQYAKPVEFYAFINSQLNELQMKAWGIDSSSIYCKVVVKKGYLPKEFNVGTIVWRESEIEYEDEAKTIPKQTSCDYVVKGIMTESLTEDWYLLQRNSSDSEKR